MADGFSLTHLENQVARVEAATRRIEAELVQTNAKVNWVANEVSGISKELYALKESFESFVEESRKTAALQKAATELVRVRQELEQNFGSYKIVRKTMLGVLQATDLALVKKTTISQVTEELMLSTPDYWLAPCLVAIAGWIGNDRDLADRAIAEAVKRDEEKTALAMALICRRNNRTNTCYEWLSIYFAKQRAQNFTESNFTYLNAYLNGVFGPDEKHMCDDYVARWMAEIQGSDENFEERQTELWRNYCSGFTVDLDSQFPNLKSSAREYARINDYVKRINSVDAIANNFSGMKNVEIEEEKLKKDIDQTLVSLISRCDEKEEPLRREEKYLMAVRYHNGDVDAAKKAVLAAERRRTEETIDLIGQMTNIIMNRPDAHPSERRTSVNFLSTYIRGGFQKFIVEKKPEFPTAISLKVDNWNGNTSDGSNATELHRTYEAQMRKACESSLASVDKSAPTKRMIWSLLLIALGVILFIASGPAFGGIVGVIGLICLCTVPGAKKQIQAQLDGIAFDYEQRIKQGHKQIDGAIAEWKRAQAIVAEFESKQVRDVVA